MKNDEIARLKRRLERREREIRRLRASWTWRLGRALSRVALPVRRLAGALARRLRLRRPYTPPADAPRRPAAGTPGTPGRFLPESRASVVWFPTNGVGFGHFTRLLALATRLRRARPDYEQVFFTTLPVLHVPEALGFPCYHVPGGSLLAEDLRQSSDWNAIVEEHLLQVFTSHRPRMFLFDGVFPYHGMLDALAAHPGLRTVWVRRRLHRTAASPTRGVFDAFDLVVHPGDAVREAPPPVPDDWPGDSMTCPPILLTDPEEILDRSAVRRAWGIPPEVVLVYVSLGAGRVGDVDSQLVLALDALGRHDEIVAVVGESMLGDRRLFDRPRVRILRDYPNALYFAAFDFAIQAAGYNAYHEMIHFGLPTLCLPNLETQSDDQRARAEVAAEAGAMRVLIHPDAAALRQAVDALRVPETRARMRDACARLRRDNGATVVARALADML